MTACDIGGCPRKFASARALYLHRMNDHTASERGELPRTGSPILHSGQVPAEYARARAERSTRRRVAALSALGLLRFSEAAADGTCPRCHGSSFKAKRSAGAKAFGAMFGIIGILAMPKSEIKCETCDLTFRKG